MRLRGRELKALLVFRLQECRVGLFLVDACRVGLLTVWGGGKEGVVNSVPAGGSIRLS